MSIVDVMKRVEADLEGSGKLFRGKPTEYSMLVQTEVHSLGDSGHRLSVKVIAYGSRVDREGVHTQGVISRYGGVGLNRSAHRNALNGLSDEGYAIRYEYMDEDTMFAKNAWYLDIDMDEEMARAEKLAMDEHFDRRAFEKAQHEKAA
tara:strand:- start:679 stop:1122 length:444 start_codon:yes stop_codon:yes gene_type:complete